MFSLTLFNISNFMITWVANLNQVMIVVHLNIVCHLVQTQIFGKLVREQMNLANLANAKRAFKVFQSLNCEIEGSTKCDAGLSSLKVNRHFTLKNYLEISSRFWITHKWRSNVIISDIHQRCHNVETNILKANKWTTFQPKNVGGKSVYIAMAKLCDKWAKIMKILCYQPKLWRKIQKNSQNFHFYNVLEV